jgi:CheY-like chemotaxis protein
VAALLRVLVVDEEPLRRWRTAMWLRRLPCYVSTAGEGKAALGAMRFHRPHLVLMNLDALRLDCGELRSQMLADQNLASIPAIFITPNIPEAIPLGFNAGFVAPYHADVLLGAIVTFLPPRSQARLRLKRSILIVGDRENRDSCHLCSRIARKVWQLGARVTLAASSTEALASMREHRPDIVVLEYDSLARDGPEFRRAMLDDPNFADIPTLLLGNNLHDPGVRRHVTRNYQDPVAFQPVHLSDISAYILRLVEGDEHSGSPELR